MADGIPERPAGDNKPANEKPQVLDFTSAECKPCQQLKKDLQVFQKQFDEGKAELVKIDADDKRNAKLLQRYSVNALPTLLFVKDGKIVDMLQGAAEESSVNIHKFASSLGKIINEDANQILHEVGIADSIQQNSQAENKENIPEDEEEEGNSPYEKLTFPGMKGKRKIIEFYEPDSPSSKSFAAIFDKCKQNYGGDQIELLRVNTKDAQYSDLVAAFAIDEYPTVVFMDGSQKLKKWFSGLKNCESQLLSGIQQLEKTSP